MSVSGLAYVALAVTDVAATAKVLEQHFGLARREARLPDGRPAPLFGIGASALALFATDDAFLGGEATTGVHHIAVAAPDPGKLVENAYIEAFAATGTTICLRSGPTMPRPPPTGGWPST